MGQVSWQVTGEVTVTGKVRASNSRIRLSVNFFKWSSNGGISTFNIEQKCFVTNNFEVVS